VRGEEGGRREQRSYGRVLVRLTVRCRVVGARLAVSLSACQPTHVGTVATLSACGFTQPTPYGRVAARTTRIVPRRSRDSSRARARTRPVSLAGAGSAGRLRCIFTVHAPRGH
jgi:hypothetical protein